MLTASTPLARAKMRAQGVIGQLRRMLSDKVVGYDDSRSGQPSPGLANAMARVGNRANAATAYGSAHASIPAGSRGEPNYSAEPANVGEAVGMVRERTAELKKAATSSSEKATIEIVALMFQSILAEERIPATVRVWFARLQMPVLRVALGEPEFFGTLAHPARKLIDRMGSSVLGFDAGINETALELEIKRVVQVIEQYPETGRRVFQLVYDEFQKFLNKFLTEQGAARRIVSVAQQVEEKETLGIQYTIEMRNMLGTMPVRDQIREFLFKVWSEVLSLAAVQHGPQHANTMDLKQVAADLVWAASAKPNRHERAKVIQDLPKLLAKLRGGMGMIGLGTAAQEDHIKTISDIFADAFLSKTEAIDPKLINAMSNRLKNLEDFISEDDVGDLPLDAESIELMLGIDISGIDIITAGGTDATEPMRAWAFELEPGAWFNLDHNGQMRKVQYAWRSAKGQLHLFAGTDGHCYLFQIRRFASYLQAGLLVAVEDESLTVRATRDALAKLDANPERLLS